MTQSLHALTRSFWLKKRAFGVTFCVEARYHANRLYVKNIEVFPVCFKICVMHVSLFSLPSGRSRFAFAKKHV